MYGTFVFDCVFNIILFFQCILPNPANVGTFTGHQVTILWTWAFLEVVQAIGSDGEHSRAAGRLRLLPGADWPDLDRRTPQVTAHYLKKYQSCTMVVERCTCMCVFVEHLEVYLWSFSFFKFVEKWENWIIQKEVQGIYSDQKICNDCPHRFVTLSSAILWKSTVSKLPKH